MTPARGRDGTAKRILSQKKKCGLKHNGLSISPSQTFQGILI